ncbi:MAG: 30S ribosomal protein S3 [Thaumarchaeota archaeon]|nr:30S ribosomal protein S3 [Nitrososphaerota archaeon]
MSASEKSAVKSILAMHRTYAEIDEYLEKELREAGYAGVDIQKNPIGSRITVYVTRPGLAIGRRGTGIKDLTERVAAKFPLPNPQIAVSEVEQPELNPRIMAARTAQIVARGTAFRRAATWTMNSIMAAGASGVEIGVAGKLRSDRSHSEKYRMGVVPKSGEASKRVVREATTDVLLKLGLYGIQVKIALKDLVPPMVEYVEQVVEAPPAPEAPAAVPAPQPTEVPAVAEPSVVVVEGAAVKTAATQEEVKPAIHTKTRRRQPKAEPKPELVAEQQAEAKPEETGAAAVEAPKEATVVPAEEAGAEKAEEPAALETVEQVAKSESKES